MGFLFGLASVFLMSAGPVVNKFILQKASPGFSALANAMISVVFFAGLQITNKRKIRFHFDQSTLLSGIFNSGGLAFLFLALQYMHPAIFGFVGRLGVVFAMVLSSLFLKQNPDRAEVFLGVLAVGGALGSAMQDFSGINIGGFVLALGSTLSFACSNLTLKFAASKADNSEVLLTTNIVSVLILFLYCLIVPEGIKVPHTLRTWELIVGGALFGSCLGFWCYLESLKHLSLSRASLLRATGPLFTAAISYPFFGLNFNNTQVVSASILLISVLLLAIYERRKKRNGRIIQTSVSATA